MTDRQEWEARQRRLGVMRWFAQILAICSALVASASWLVGEGSTAVLVFSWVGLAAVTALTIRGHRMAKKTRATWDRIEEAEVLLNWMRPD